MDRIINFFKAKSFAILLFHIGVLLFSWPLLSLSAETGGAPLFVYLLIFWALIVFALVIMGSCISISEENNRKQ